MWNIANIPMVVTKWSPEVEEEEEVEITTIPMWIVLKNVPRRMFSWNGLGFIASVVGKPKRLHPDTILCKSFEEAKVFVEADMTKELPKSHRFKSKLGVDADVQLNTLGFHQSVRSVLNGVTLLKHVEVRGKISGFSKPRSQRKRRRQVINLASPSHMNQ